MKKSIRKIVSVVLIVTLILAYNITIFASEYPENVGDVVDGSLLTNDESSELILKSRTRGNILDSGIARLSDNGNGSVNSYGAVMAAVICDRLELRLTLQRLQGGTWTTVKTFSNTAYNTSLLTKSYNTNVTGGYYYRLKAACIAFDGGASESQMTVTIVFCIN